MQDRERIERWLAEHGVQDYELDPRFDLSRIDKKASHQNQARIGAAIDDDHVLLVGQAVAETPSDIPPIVVYAPKGKRSALTVSGNHRAEAFDLNDVATWPAYVITQELTDLQLYGLAVTANRHGKPTTLEEREMQAAHLVTSEGLSSSDAAELLGLPVHRVRAHVSVQNAANRLRACGIDPGQFRGRKTLQRLEAIHDDDVLAATARMVASTSMDSTEVSDFVTRVRKLRSTSAQLALIETVQRERQSVKARSNGRVKTTTPIELRSFRQALTTIDRSDPALMTAADPAELRARMNKASRKLARDAKKVR